MEIETGELIRMVGRAQKRPENTIVLKLKGLLMSSKEWLKKDGSKMYTCLIYSEAVDGVIKFNTSRLLPKGKEAEVMLTLSGFNAYEALR